MENKNSLIKSLNQRVGALRKLSRFSSFKTRKMVANGIFISKLIYLMPVWLGCDEYLVNALQVCQNEAARVVTKLDRFTPIKVLLTQCGWLSVKQLMIYHSLVLLHRVFQTKKPDFLYQKITAGPPQPNIKQAAATARALADYCT